MKLVLYEDLSAESAWDFRDKFRNPTHKAALHLKATHRRHRLKEMFLYRPTVVENDASKSSYIFNGLN
jgi:hypothetical protein